MLLRFFFVLTLIFSFKTQARWASVGEAPSERFDSLAHFKVAADGSYTMVYSEKVKILNEKGRENHSVYKISYNPDAANVEVLEAYSETAGKKIPLTKRYMTEETFGNDGNGFDSEKVIKLAFNHLDVGSSYYVKFKKVVKKVPLPGIFNKVFYTGWFDKHLSGKMIIESEMPLYMEENDPTGALKVVRTPNLIRAEITKPVFHYYKNEPYDHVDYKKFTWLQVSSVRKWEELALPLIDSYEKIVAKELPKVFLPIVEEAQGLKKAPGESLSSFNDRKINLVTSLLAQKMRYLGDWRTVEGGYIPRPLEEIARTRFGDCKDFSAMTVKMLRLLGFEAYFTWIERGAHYRNFPGGLPNDGEFNHAIVHVKKSDKNDRARWIDPTNISSFAHGIYHDIIDRRALVLFPSAPKLLRTPKARPSDGRGALSFTVDFLPDGKKEVQVEINLEGRSATQFTAAALYRPQKEVERSIINHISDGRAGDSWRFEPFDLTNRIVQDLHMKAYFTEEKGGNFRTTAGRLYSFMENGIYRKIYNFYEDRVSGIYLDVPMNVNYTFNLRGIEIVGTEDLGCQVDTPWFAAKRSYVKTPSGLTMKESLSVKERVIAPEDLVSKTFVDAREIVRECFQNVGVVYQLKSSGKRPAGD